MSNIYIQEPPTNGKVLLVTSLGDIDVELWSKESPRATRNFLQLCLEGYYDGTVFHRVIRDFIAQGGDPTGTGDGGESAYDQPFKVERHSRLRFVRRGLVATANAPGRTDDCSSQFFFTLSPAPDLQDKHTVFGKVAGDTLYNMLKFNDVVTDSDDKPVSAPKIIRTEILSNPFDDIVPREDVGRKKRKKREKGDKQKSKSKATKDFALLSFGGEAEVDEAEVAAITETLTAQGQAQGQAQGHGKRGKSVHDMEGDPGARLTQDTEEKREADLASVREKLKRKASDLNQSGKQAATFNDTGGGLSDDDDVKVREDTDRLAKPLTTPESDSKTTRIEHGSGTVTGSKKHPPSASEGVMREYERGKEVYVERKRELTKGGKGSREKQTLALLAKFQSNLGSVQGEEAEGELKDTKRAEDDEIKDLTWTRYSLVGGDSAAPREVRDANLPPGDDQYDMRDPRNDIVRRRRENSKRLLVQRDKGRPDASL